MPYRACLRLSLLCCALLGAGTVLAARVSDAAGAGFALGNQVAATLFIVFRIIGIGIGVVVSQSLGGRQARAAAAVARAALDETWQYATERQAFGQPLSAFQGVSHRLAEFDTQVEACRLLCYQALWAKGILIRITNRRDLG